MRRRNPKSKYYKTQRNTTKSQIQKKVKVRVRMPVWVKVMVREIFPSPYPNLLTKYE